MSEINESNRKSKDGYTQYGVVWMNIPTIIRPKPFVIGVCKYAWKPCFIGDFLQELTVHDLLLNEETGECEESQRCLSLSCRFNKTTPESYAASRNSSSEKEIARTKKDFAKIGKAIALFQPYADKCKKLFGKNSRGGVIDFSGET